jgi:hypothetical protein
VRIRKIWNVEEKDSEDEGDGLRYGVKKFGWRDF